MGRGVTGLILKAMRADDYVFTVIGNEAVNEHYQRIRFAGGDFLTTNGWYPTMWVRLWVPKSGLAAVDPDAGDLVQRGYTIIEPDGGEFAIEFALHEGPAPRWARAARPGDQIAATLMGSEFAFPDTPPSEYVLIGDTASLPAINSVLARADAPTRVFLEYQHDSETRLPVHGTDVTWVPRRGRGAELVESVRRAKVSPRAFAFVAAESKATRETVKLLKRDCGLTKSMIKSQAYWLDRGH